MTPICKLSECFPETKPKPPIIKCGTWLYNTVQKNYGVFIQTDAAMFQYITFDSLGGANRCSKPMHSNNGFEGFTLPEVQFMIGHPTFNIKDYEVVNRPW